MALFDLLKEKDINQGVEEWKATTGAILLDVRSRDEYSEGHIPGSRNIPLNELAAAADGMAKKDTPVFVYCLSGGRSKRAVAFLKKIGYANVQNIGGINSYKGKMEV